MTSNKKKVTKSEFVKRAILSMRTDKSKGIHTVFSGFNDTFRFYYDGQDPVEWTGKLQKQGIIDIRPCKGGAMIYLKGESPVKRNSVDKDAFINELNSMNNDFSSRLKELRNSFGYSKKELADKVGLGETTINKHEHGIGHPSFNTLLKLSHIFGVSTDYLLGKDKEKWNGELPESIREIVLDPENEEWILMIPYYKQSGMSPQAVRAFIAALSKLKD